ncbi:unannotated protein [freshwater metagenome]|uniref:Unannotated protein n=1 Tax=freshwater metagenome TaxID=449393 RepID=A0A6J6R506_9ZZZZ
MHHGVALIDMNHRSASGTAGDRNKPTGVQQLGNVLLLVARL